MTVSYLPTARPHRHGIVTRALRPAVARNDLAEPLHAPKPARPPRWAMRAAHNIVCDGVPGCRLTPEQSLVVADELRAMGHPESADRLAAAALAPFNPMAAPAVKSALDRALSSITWHRLDARENAARERRAHAAVDTLFEAMDDAESGVADIENYHARALQAIERVQHPPTRNLMVDVAKAALRRHYSPNPRTS